MVNVNVESSKNRILTLVETSKNRTMLRRVGKFTDQMITPPAKITKHKPWSKKEITLLIELYKHQPIGIVAKRLNRCAGSVRNKLYELQIFKARPKADVPKSKAVIPSDIIGSSGPIGMSLALLSFLSMNLVNINIPQQFKWAMAKALKQLGSATNILSVLKGIE